MTAPGQTTPQETIITTTRAPSSSGPNKASVAAGVVVGIVALSAIAGGIFFFLRNRKRRAVEEEYRRNVAGGYGAKPPASSAGSVSDARLEPSVMMQRRQSDGSIADNQDYSRRILKVCPISCGVRYDDANIGQGYEHVTSWGEALLPSISKRSVGDLSRMCLPLRTSCTIGLFDLGSRRTG